MHKHDFCGRVLSITTLVTHRFKTEDRRRKVATLLAQSLTETEILHELKVDQSTIGRDVKVVKELSNNYVFIIIRFATHGYTNQSERESIFNPYS
ncbi:MAG TPA: hypothetical protein VH500_16510 [Nitrososphaeraceae archaeon]|jgi:IS30 family transposase